MILYNIWWHDGCGHRDHVDTTNDLDKWLVDHNKSRVNEGERTEELDDFEIELVDSCIY